MINENPPSNSLINMIRKKYNSCNGGISNKMQNIMFVPLIVKLTENIQFEFRAASFDGRPCNVIS